MLEYWYMALNSPLGVCLRTSDPERLRQRLYAARREAADPQLDSISVAISPTAEDEVWLVKRKPNGTP